MRRRLLLGMLALVLSACLVLVAFLSLSNNNAVSSSEAFYLGVTAGGSVEETKSLVDKVRDYANLLVITNLDIAKNKTSLEVVTDYAAGAGMSFLVYMLYPSRFAVFNYDPFSWISEAKDKYGEQFLGVYLYDEPGGNQLDRGDFRQFDNTTMPCNYRDAANTYAYYLFVQMREFIKIDKLFTSDYALYWFDYEAGYDVVLGQFGWNNSRPLNVALCRGAAEMHNKEWGVMMAWTYRQAPYIESASELYQDMVTAYEAGAKYVVVFNYPKNVTNYGILTEAHFDAIKSFKEFTTANPQNNTSNISRVAYVMPENYGWGLRSPEDTIWGVWKADNKSQVVWDGIAGMIQTYGDDFDVVYDSPWTRFFGRDHYDRMVWWNATK